MERLNRKAIATEMARRTNTDPKEAELMLRAALTVIGEALVEEKAVSITGFGSWEPKTLAARSAFNPRTREKVQVDKSVTVRFKPGRNLHTALNGGGLPEGRALVSKNTKPRKP